MADEEDEVLNPRNFLNKMYQNDGFLYMKAQFEKELIMQTKMEMERKYMLDDADRVLKELKEWREKRDALLEEEKKEESEEEEEIGQIKERGFIEEDPLMLEAQ